MLSVLRKQSQGLQAAALLALAAGTSESVAANPGTSKAPAVDAGLSALHMPLGQGSPSHTNRATKGTFLSERQLRSMELVAQTFRLAYPEKSGSQVRREAFMVLDEQGVLAAAGLTPTQRSAVLWCAEYGIEAVVPVIYRVGLSGTSKQTTEASLVDAMSKAALGTEASDRQALSSREVEYGRGLQFLYALIGEQDQHYSSAEQQKQLAYVRSISLDHIALLRRVHGACFLYDRLPALSEAKIVTGSFIRLTKDQITARDQEAFPYLAEQLSVFSVSPDLPGRLAFVSAIFMGGVGLWLKLQRKRTAARNLTSAS